MDHSQNAVSLPGIPDRLRRLSSRLHIDKHIQGNIQQLVDQTVRCAETFNQSMKENADRLYVQGQLVNQATDPKQIKGKTLQKALKDTRSSFSLSKMEILKLQANVHDQIETCRGQVNVHKAEQTTKTQKIEKSRRDITDLRDKITRNDTDANDLDRTARGLTDREAELRREASKKTDAGAFGGIISAVVGVVLAPFTGGASLIIGSVAAGITMGVNFNDAIDCSNKASDCRTSACEKRKEASKLRDDVTKMETTIDGLQKDVTSLKERIVVLEDAIKALQDVTTFLSTSVGVADEVVDAIQDMDAVVKETLLVGSGFFVSLRAKKKEMAQRQLQNLKDSWERLQKTMTRNRRYALRN